MSTSHTTSKAVSEEELRKVLAEKIRAELTSGDPEVAKKLADLFFSVILKDETGTELSEYLKNLNVGLDTRASESTLSTISGKLDANLSTRASESTLSSIKSKTDNLDALLSTRASENTLSSLNSKLNSLLQFIDGTLIINPRFFYKIYEGYGFSISNRFENVASDASVNIYFENPAGSGREVFIIVIDVISFAQAWIDVYRDVTPSGGTAITPVNLNFGSAITSVATVKYGVTYSGGTLVHSTVCPGGSKVQATGGAAEVGETVVIPEGFNFLVKVTNKSTGATDLSIRIVWWEEP
jgi:hypothetical protein